MNNSTETSNFFLSAEALRGVGAALREDRAPDDAAGALRRVGAGLGAALTSGDLGEGAGPETEAEKFWNGLSERLSTAGLGEFRHSSLHPGVAALDSSDSAEADPSAGYSHPCCHLTTGVLAGVLRPAAGREIAVMEAECRSRGDQRCRFLVGARPTLERLHGDLAAGRGVEQAVAALG